MSGKKPQTTLDHRSQEILDAIRSRPADPPVPGLPDGYRMLLTGFWQTRKKSASITRL